MELKLLVSAPFVSLNKAIPNRLEIKEKFGFNDKFVIGTVMRNQRRKRFPELFRAFGKIVEEKDDVVLYCHTSYPDSKSWDIPALLIENNIQNHVYFDHTCQNCNNSYPKLFQGITSTCIVCKEQSLILTNLKFSMSAEEMNYMYNQFDLYVQFVSNEAQGMPQCEAAAVGCPVIATDYSAMQDIIPKIGGDLIKSSQYREPESTRYMGVPSEEHFVELVDKYYNLYKNDNKVYQEKRKDVLSKYNSNYSWDKTYSSWKTAIDNAKTKTKWDSNDINIKNIPSLDKNILSLPNKDFARFCTAKVIQSEKYIGSIFENQIISDLNNTLRISMHSKTPISKQDIYEECKKIRSYINTYEELRCQKLCS